MDQWACDRRDLRVNSRCSLREPHPKNDTLRWRELYNIEAPHLRAALEALEKAEVELNLLNYASKSFAPRSNAENCQGATQCYLQASTWLPFRKSSATYR